MDGQLDSKVCVITGGGRGIGAAIAAVFADQGARVAILDRDLDVAQEVCADLKRRGADGRTYAVDIRIEEQVRATMDRVAADFGDLDVLVNNAGISRLGPSLDFSLADWQESLDVMLTGAFLCSRESGRLMRSRGGGAIVNVSSINGLVAFPMRLAYSAAKAGLISMTNVLAAEWASYGIRVNAVAPGNTETTMVRDAIDQGMIDLNAYLTHTPLRRLAQPREIAEAVLYLASERSSYVTGQVLAVDGGWTSFGWIPWSGDPDAPGIEHHGGDRAGPEKGG